MQPTVCGENTVVFFDLETTGLVTSVCDIIQLSAISGERDFNVFILPTRPIDPRATRVTGFTSDGINLYLHDNPVPTVPLQQALDEFIVFLRSFQKPLLLAAHNALRFDGPVFARALELCNLTGAFKAEVSRFVDTLLLSKALFPSGLPSYSQEKLAWHFLDRTYNAHYAVEDAKILQDLFKAWNPSIHDVLNACVGIF